MGFAVKVLGNTMQKHQETEGHEFIDFLYKS